MTGILEMTGSSVLAVTAGVLPQASYHVYYGRNGLLVVAALFLIFACVFGTHSPSLLPTK